MAHLAGPEDFGTPNHDGMPCTLRVQKMFVPNYWTNYQITGHPLNDSDWDFSGCPVIDLFGEKLVGVQKLLGEKLVGVQKLSRICCQAAMASSFLPRV